MEIIMKRLDELKPYEKNPRKNDAAVPKVMESIKKFGFKVPLVISSDGVIITGHTRFKAAKKLEYETVPCIIADDLNEKQIKAFRLADNKVSEFSVWDYDLLSEELKDIETDFDIGDFGFNLDVQEMQEYDDSPEDEKEHEEKERGYAIVYEIAFNNEDEQKEWYEFLNTLKRKYPDVDTIAERILIAARDWMNGSQ